MTEYRINLDACIEADSLAEAYAELHRMLKHVDGLGWESNDGGWYDEDGNEIPLAEIDKARQQFFEQEPEDQLPAEPTDPIDKARFK